MSAGLAGGHGRMGVVATNDEERAAPRTRTVVVTFLGSVVRSMGDWMPIGGTVDLLGEVGLDPTSVRTAVFRLKKRGWLESETHGGVRGYALTRHALASLAAGDEVIWHARRPAALDDGWCVVNFSVPETERAKRHQLRSHLAALGFGNVGTAMWIAPARMRAAAEQAIGELELTSYSAVFVGPHVGGQDLRTLVARSWDLDGIAEGYREFLDRFGGTSMATPFASYVSLVDSWRRLPFRDPGLPVELLPADWPAGDALGLFEGLVARLEPPALAHARERWAPASAAG